MINTMVVLLLNIFLFLVIDWREWKQAKRWPRLLYLLMLGISCAVWHYLNRSMDPFYPADWINALVKGK